MSLVGVPPQLHAGPLSVENLPVQLQAVAVSVVSNSSVVADVSAAAPVDAAITAATTNSGALAAATGDFATALGHTIATVAGLALAPIWYLAFPDHDDHVGCRDRSAVLSGLSQNVWDSGFAVFTSWFVSFKLDDILFSTVLAPAATSAATARAAATATATATASPATEVPAADTAAIATAAAAPRRRVPQQRLRACGGPKVHSSQTSGGRARTNGQTGSGRAAAIRQINCGSSVISRIQDR